MIATVYSYGLFTMHVIGQHRFYIDAVALIIQRHAVLPRYAQT